MKLRFQSVNASPPGGCYSYGVGDDVVESSTRSGICQKARELRRKHGLPVAGDCFQYVMEYMCPRLPSGFCTQPSQVRYLRAEDVKANTARLFGAALAARDDIASRMQVCVECPKHTRNGFCVDCTGLLDWIYRGFNGRRLAIPHDRALGVCMCDDVLAAAGASVLKRPLAPGVSYPERCWRLTQEQNHGQA